MQACSLLVELIVTRFLLSWERRCFYHGSPLLQRNIQCIKEIGADNVGRSLASVNLSSSPSASKSSSEGGHVDEDSQWFMSINKPLSGATAHQRKLDFDLLSVGLILLVLLMYNQSDRLFLFDLLVHGKKCFVTVFLFTCVVLAQPIDMESECLILVRLISKIYSAGALGRGRDPRFARYWRTVSIDLGPSNKKNRSKSGYFLIYRLKSCEESNKLELVLLTSWDISIELSHCSAGGRMSCYAECLISRRIRPMFE